MGPTVTRPVRDPLAVLLFDNQPNCNQLYKSLNSHMNLTGLLLSDEWGEIIICCIARVSNEIPFVNEYSVKASKFYTFTSFAKKSNNIQL